MFERYQLEAMFAQGQRFEDLRSMFVDFAADMEEILPDCPAKRDFFTYLKQAAGCAMEAWETGPTPESTQEVVTEGLASKETIEAIKKFPTELLPKLPPAEFLKKDLSIPAPREEFHFGEKDDD